MATVWTAADMAVNLEKGGALLVDFYADWCMPCKMMAPVLDKVADAFDGRLTVAKINVDDEQELAVKYGIQSIPALLLFKNGDVVKEFIGVRPFDELSAAIEAAL
ncbi:MAG: thioredoxin [Ruminococcaceae bacterium]|nr:thioredoxin [Oscillospiraceae bacterium]